MRARPLIERLKLLAKLLKKALENIRFSEALRRARQELLEAGRRFQLESLIAKRPDSLYEPGRCSEQISASAKAGEREEAVSATVPPSPAPSQDPGTAQAERPGPIQSQDSAVPKSLTLRAPLVVFLMILIVGLIWFAGSKLSHSGREAALPTPISTPTTTSTPTPTMTLTLAPTRTAPTPTPAPAFPLDPALYYSRGWDFYQGKQYDKAISEYNEAIRLEPNNAAYYFARGVAYIDTKDYDKAISDYNEAVRLEPDNAAAYNNRGTAYDEMEKYDKAISDYNDAIKLEPNFASAYHNRGITYRKQGKDAGAQADFDKAKQLGYSGPQ